VGGLVLDVERPTRATLRVEVAGRGLLLLRQDAAVALVARIDDDRGGVEYAGTGRFRSPIPPIRTTAATAMWWHLARLCQLIASTSRRSPVGGPARAARPGGETGTAGRRVAGEDGTAG
jgi:hypothetical protein